MNYIKSSILDYNKLQCQKNDLNRKEIIINKDLTENYSIKLENEIMSAHWSIQAINLFCATAYYLNRNNEKQMKYYFLCFDDLVHDENSIYFLTNR